jgi:hypothetical protein
MGLAMVHGIVHDHGGQLGLHTRVGEGTTDQADRHGCMASFLNLSGTAGYSSRNHCGWRRLPRCLTTWKMKEMTMGMKRGLGAVALVTAAAIAGAGWALQAPNVEAPVSVGHAPELASPSSEMPGLSLSVLGWPRPAQEPDDDSTADAQADDEPDIEGLEAMSATGAASPRD